jgi:hypothetical protein
MRSIKWASSHYPHKWRTFYRTPWVMADRYSPFWDLRKVLGSPTGVEVKLKLALCQWVWVGACQQLVRLVWYGESNEKLKKKKNLYGHALGENTRRCNNFKHIWKFIIVQINIIEAMWKQNTLNHTSFYKL